MSGVVTWRATRRAAVAAAMLLPAVGCVATKGDVRLLQDELRAMRSASAVADTARRAQTDSVLTQVARANDSLRVLSLRFSTFQAGVATFQSTASGELYDMGRQLLQIQELTGQTQRRLQEVRARLESQQETGGVAPPAGAPAAPTDTAARAAAGPGPAQLFQIGTEQMSRGSYRSARDAFQDLLARYPTFDDAAAAQLHIGESYALEGNAAAADSVYQLVVRTYPKDAPSASTALYKRAEMLRGAKKSAEARQLLQRIIREYPRTDAASLARDLLATMR